MPAAPSPRDVAVGLVVTGARVGAAGAHLALLPVALAARAPLVGPRLRRAAEDLAGDGSRAIEDARAWLETRIEDAIAAPEVERAIDRALAGPLAEAIAHSLAEHRVVERVVAEMDVEQLVVRALDSRTLLEITDRVLVSAEMQHALRHIAESPELRRAIAEQSSGLAEEMAGGVRRRTSVLDDAAEQAVRGWLRRRPRPS